MVVFDEINFTPFFRQKMWNRKVNKDDLNFKKPKKKELNFKKTQVKNVTSIKIKIN